MIIFNSIYILVEKEARDGVYTGVYLILTFKVI